VPFIGVWASVALVPSRWPCIVSIRNVTVPLVLSFNSLMSTLQVLTINYADKGLVEFRFVSISTL
jgi:hypothetical protein